MFWLAALFSFFCFQLQYCWELCVCFVFSMRLLWQWCHLMDMFSLHEAKTKQWPFQTFAELRHGILHMHLYLQLHAWTKINHQESLWRAPLGEQPSHKNSPCCEGPEHHCISGIPGCRSCIGCCHLREYSLVTLRQSTESTKSVQNPRDQSTDCTDDVCFMLIENIDPGVGSISSGAKTWQWKIPCEWGLRMGNHDIGFSNKLGKITRVYMGL